MISLPAFFSDDMVVGKRMRIWGKTAPGQEVKLSFLGQETVTVANENGRFEAILTAENYGGPFTMTVGERVLKDVYVGRLWLCGGQSNMEQPLSRTRSLLRDYIKEDTRIRAFQVAKDVKFDGPATDVLGEWHDATGDFLEHLHAVPYFFARYILDVLKDDVPMGLVNFAAGGTPVEGWLPKEIVREYPALYEKLETMRSPGYMARLQTEAEAASRIWYDELNKKDPGLPTDATDWHNRQLLDNTDLTYGTVWYRKRFCLDAVPTGEVTFALGRAADSVKAYINGREIISVDYQYPPCVCTVPRDVLRVGENEVLVRVVGSGQKPHFVPGKEYALTGAGFYLDLSGEWLCRIGAEMPQLVGSPWFYGYPCCVYNYMLAPLLGLITDGLIWYQGESNTGNPVVYKELFARFVAMLRQHCGADLPVFFTQLANYIDPNSDGEGWAQLREQQRLCLEIPNTAMAVAIDCGEYNDLHPQDKKTVGERLALHALKQVYAQDIITDGPTVSRVERDETRLVVHFNNVRGLWAKNGRPPVDIVTTNEEVHRVFATVAGQTLVINTGSVPAAIVSSAKKLRFGWTDNPPVTLYNAYGLPASPFEMKI